MQATKIKKRVKTENKVKKIKDKPQKIKSNNAKRVLRVLVWLVLALIFVRGVFSFIRPNPINELQKQTTAFMATQGKADIQKEQASAYANQFVKSYFTYSKGADEAYKNSLSKYLSKNVSFAGMKELSTNAKVQSSSTYKIEKYSDTQYDVYVVANVEYENIAQEEQAMPEQAEPEQTEPEPVEPEQPQEPQPEQAEPEPEQPQEPQPEPAPEQLPADATPEAVPEVVPEAVPQATKKSSDITFLTSSKKTANIELLADDMAEVFITTQVLPVYVKVPVSVSDAGCLIEELPLLVGEPQKDEHAIKSFEANIADGTATTGITQVVKDFLSVYYSENQNKIDYFLSKEADIQNFTAVNGRYTLSSVENVQCYASDKESNVYLAIVQCTIKDINNNLIPQRFNILLKENQDKYYIQDMTTRTGDLQYDFSKNS